MSVNNTSKHINFVSVQSHYYCLNTVLNQVSFLWALAYLQVIAEYALRPLLQLNVHSANTIGWLQLSPRQSSYFKRQSSDTNNDDQKTSSNREESSASVGFDEA